MGGVLPRPLVPLPEVSHVEPLVPLLLLQATLIATVVLLKLAGTYLTLTISERVFFDKLLNFVVGDVAHG